MSIRVVVGTVSISGSVLFAGIAAAQDNSVRSQLAGSYTLESIYDLLKGGEKHDTWGKGVKGSLFLSPSGQFAVQIVSGDRDKTNAKTPRDPVGPIVTYFGTYTVDGDGKGLTYHVERSSFPKWDGIDRQVTIESATGGELKIETNVVGDPKLGDFKAYQTWKRADH